MRRLWRDHSLTVVVGALLVLDLGAAVWLHRGHPWPQLAEDIAVDLSGELSAILGALWLFKGLRERGSPESGDDD